MGTVVIREYSDLAHDRSGLPTVLAKGVLATDELGLPIKTVTTISGTPVDAAALTSRTRFIEIEASADTYYAVRPKERATALPATTSHRKLTANVPAIEAVHPGAIISFREV